jgi:hypothetical protein
LSTFPFILSFFLPSFLLFFVPSHAPSQLLYLLINIYFFIYILYWLVYICLRLPFFLSSILLSFLCSSTSIACYPYSFISFYSLLAGLFSVRFCFFVTYFLPSPYGQKIRHQQTILRLSSN